MKRRFLSSCLCALLSVSAAGGMAHVANAEPPAAAKPQPVAADPPAPRSPWPSYILWATGGAALNTGSIFGISALSARSDYEAAPSYEGADAVHDRAVAADVFLGLGLILGITGTLFYVLDSDEGARASAPPRPDALTLRF